MGKMAGAELITFFGFFFISASCDRGFGKELRSQAFLPVFPK